jgi:PAS domain S-box-containing protein|tara:strand:- start:2589 stop:5108 length:2520 start_codon:yes stop_codon:yes gene_type:complete
MFRLIFLRRSNISLFTFLGGYALVAGYLIYQVVVVLGASDQRETAPNLLLVIALFILASIQFRHIFLLQKSDRFQLSDEIFESGTGYLWINPVGDILLASYGAYSLLQHGTLVGRNVATIWNDPKDVENIHSHLHRFFQPRVKATAASSKDSEQLSFTVNQGSANAVDFELSWADLVDNKSVLVRIKLHSENSNLAPQQDHQAIKQLLMDGSLSARVIIDGEGLVVDINNATEELFGYTPKELIGKPMAEFIVPERLRSAHYNGLARYLATGEEKIVGHRVEISGLHKSGEEMPVELAVSAVNLTGDIYFGAEMRDLREEHANKEIMREAQSSAEFANEAKSRFLATMSHEIRTPLNALLGIVNLVRADLQDPHQVSLLTTAENSGLRLMSLLKNVLDYSKIEAGEMSVDETTFSPAATARDLVALYKPTAQAQGIKLRMRDSNISEYFTLGDDHKVTQIISNLLSNAIKFTEAGEIEVTVEKSAVSKLPNQDAALGENFACYKIHVRDTGIGMTPTQTEDVFTAFVQADDSDTRKYLGTGLGLSISQHLAHLMGGDISVVSQKGEGSCFTLELPLQIVPGLVTMPPVHRRAGPINVSKRILLVEDSAPNQLVVKAALERRGYTVEVVDSGLAACELIAKGRPSQDQFGLVLMDVQMPGMDGLEATRWMRKQNFKQPIIALTAKAYKEDERACLEAGMDDFLTKPIDYDLLSSRISMWLDHEGSSANLSGTRMQEIRELMGETAFREALAVFAIEVEARLEDVQSGLAADDFVKVDRACHTLSGVFSGYGFDELHHICSAIQESCVAKIRPVPKTVERLNELAEELLVKVRAYSANAFV